MSAPPKPSASSPFDSFMRDLHRNRVLGEDGRVYRDPNSDRWSGVDVYDFGPRVFAGHPDFMGVELIKSLVELGRETSNPLHAESIVLCLGDGKIDTVWLLRIEDGDVVREANFTRNVDIQRAHGIGWYSNLELPLSWIITPLLVLSGYLSHAQIIPIGEPGHRLLAVNRKRKFEGLKPVSVTRTIHLSELRRVYEARASEPKGGTHLPPVEHTRTITDRLITPRNRKPYRRRPKVITVNPGNRRQTYTFVEA